MSQALSYIYYMHIELSQQPFEVDTLLIYVLHIRKTRFRKLAVTQLSVVQTGAQLALSDSRVWARNHQDLLPPTDFLFPFPSFFFQGFNPLCCKGTGNCGGLSTGRLGGVRVENQQLKRRKGLEGRRESSEMKAAFFLLGTFCPSLQGSGPVTPQCFMGTLQSSGPPGTFYRHRVYKCSSSYGCPFGLHFRLTSLQVMKPALKPGAYIVSCPRKSRPAEQHSSGKFCSDSRTCRAYRTDFKGQPTQTLSLQIENKQNKTTVTKRKEASIWFRRRKQCIVRCLVMCEQDHKKYLPRQDGVVSFFCACQVSLIPPLMGHGGQGWGALRGAKDLPSIHELGLDFDGSLSKAPIPLHLTPSGLSYRRRELFLEHVSTGWNLSRSQFSYLKATFNHAEFDLCTLCEESVSLNNIIVQTKQRVMVNS